MGKLILIKKICKWIALMLLAVLVILSIVFQVSWKITAILAVFLIACTILPKKFRKWFWASVGAIVLALVIWVFLPEDNTGWQPYKLTQEITNLNEKYAVPENENAAVIYNKLLAEYDVNTFEPNVCDFPIFRPWSGKEYPELFQWIQGQKNIIAALQESAKKDRCWFMIQSNTFQLDKTLKRNSAMRQWAYMLVTAANNDLYEGRINDALEKCRCVIMMAKHICQQPKTIDLLTGIAVGNLALLQFNRFVVTGNPSEDNLNFIEESLKEIGHDWTSDLPKIFEDDKMSAKEILGSFYEINQNGKTRFSRDPLAVTRAQMKSSLADEEFKSHLTEEQMKKLQKLSQELSYWLRKYFKARSILYWFSMPPTPQKAAKIIDTSYEKFYAMQKPDYKWSEKPDRPFHYLTKCNFNYFVKCCVDMAERSYYSLHDIYLRTASDKNSCLILIAIKHYKNQNGNWPQNLDQIKPLVPSETLIDPQNNSSFVYKLSDDTFTLYSKGQNNVDENGQYESNWPQEAKPDDRLIWPPKGYISKEKNTNDQKQ